MTSEQSTQAPIEVLHRDSLPLGGFAGLVEHRLVMDPKAWGKHANPTAWPGLGNFVYLADARFLPKGETGMHPHHEIDVISVIVEGRIKHGGTLENGRELQVGDVQVQRAGSEGFYHNELNPDDEQNRMLQLWVLPEHSGEPAGYQTFKPQAGEVTRVYGGREGQETFASRTIVEVAQPQGEQTVSVDGEFIGYVARGNGVANGKAVTDGDLLRGETLTFSANDDVLLILIRIES